MDCARGRRVFWAGALCGGAGGVRGSGGSDALGVEMLRWQSEWSLETDEAGERK